MQEFYEFSLGTRVLYQPGLVTEIGTEIQRLRGSKALIVADKGIVAAGLLEPIKMGLRGTIELVGVFDAVPSNSSVQAVEAGAAYAMEQGADILIAVGGGSPLDTAKCMRIIMTHGGQLADHEGFNVLEQLGKRLTPMMAVPTTIGTGSEVTPYAMILDEEQQLKLSFASAFLTPELALLDPEMTRTLPTQLAAATGMDALCHAIEALVSNSRNPFSDSLALHAIDIISNHLRDAIETITVDLEARGRMLIAACMAGIACSNTLFGVIHALSHAIGGQFQTHHGTLNAILMPYGMHFNSPILPEQYVRIARAMGVNVGGRSDTEVIADGITAVRTLTHDCDLPMRLRDLNIPEEALAELAETALVDGAMLNNPRSATSEELWALLRDAW